MKKLLTALLSAALMATPLMAVPTLASAQTPAPAAAGMPASDALYQRMAERLRTPGGELATALPMAERAEIAAGTARHA